MNLLYQPRFLSDLPYRSKVRSVYGRVHPLQNPRVGADVNYGLPSAARPVRPRTSATYPAGFSSFSYSLNLTSCLDVHPFNLRVADELWRFRRLQIPGLDEDAPTLPHVSTSGPRGQAWRRNVWVGKHTFTPIHRDP